MLDTYLCGFWACQDPWKYVAQHPQNRSTSALAHSVGSLCLCWWALGYLLGLCSRNIWRAFWYSYIICHMICLLRANAWRIRRLTSTLPLGACTWTKRANTPGKTKQRAIDNPWAQPGCTKKFWGAQSFLFRKLPRPGPEQRLRCLCSLQKGFLIFPENSKQNQKPEFSKNPKIFKKQSKIRGFPRIFGKNRLFFECFLIFRVIWWSFWKQQKFKF